MENLTTQLKWDSRFKNICDEIATWSTCLSRNIGAILVRDSVIIATGFNGPPRGIPHCGKERNETDKDLQKLFSELKDADVDVLGTEDTCVRQRLDYPSGRGLHLCPAVHAEDNCIANAARVGISTINSTLYVSCGVPCKDCLKKLINAGIIEIVCENLDCYDELSRWLISESNINVRTYEKKG